MHARDFRIDLKISVMRKSPASDFRITENVGLSRPCSHTVAVPPCAGIEGRGATLHFSVMRKSLASDVRSTEACRIAPSVFADGGGVPVRRHWREGGSLTMFGNARVACERRSIRVHACALARARVRARVRARTPVRACMTTQCAAPCMPYKAIVHRYSRFAQCCASVAQGDNAEPKRSRGSDNSGSGRNRGKNWSAHEWNVWEADKVRNQVAWEESWSASAEAIGASPKRVGRVNWARKHW